MKRLCSSLVSLEMSLETQSYLYIWIPRKVLELKPDILLQPFWHELLCPYKKKDTFLCFVYMFVFKLYSVCVEGDFDPGTFKTRCSELIPYDQAAIPSSQYVFTSSKNDYNFVFVGEGGCIQYSQKTMFIIQRFVF